MLAHFLRSELLDHHGFCHAFFTRQGGVSEGPYSSLNFSVSVGDSAACVAQNFARAAHALGVATHAIPVLSQVHGSAVWELASPSPESPIPSADGMVSGNSELACGVRTADCVPILVADMKTGRAAALHAGWRGVVANIAAVGVVALGGLPQDHIAAIGPHISADAFEVGVDVAEQLACCSAEQTAVRFVGNGKAYVNLRKIVRQQLRSAGIPEAQVDDVFGCTFANPDLFFSFRRDGAISGRHLSAIRPR